MSHLIQLQQRRYTTCFGMAEEILSQLEKGLFDPVKVTFSDEAWEDEAPPAKGEALMVERDAFLLRGIQWPENDRGDQRIFSASRLALATLNEQLEAPGIHIHAGWKTMEDGNVRVWVEQFDPAHVQFRAAKAMLNDFKDVFKPAGDPAWLHSDLSLRADTYWMGPFHEHSAPTVHGIISTLMDFYDAPAIPYRQVNMNDGRYSCYVGSDHAPLTELLEKERISFGPDLPPK